MIRFCKPITTKAADVNKIVNDNSETTIFSGILRSSVCPDGAPLMLGRNSHFAELVKADASHQC